MSKELEKELESTKQKVQELTAVLKQVLVLVTVSGRADLQSLLNDIKFIIEAELNNK